MRVTKLCLALATFSLVFAVAILHAQPAYAFSGGGAGTSGDPYEIYTCAQLQEISDDLSAYYELEDDIDCTGVSYTPIGTSGTPFTGTLDGKLQTISHVTISSGSDNGIFGETDGATIKNLKLSNNTITGTSTLGTLVGNAVDGAISNIRADSTNTVTGTGGDVGGLIGEANGSTVAISKVYFGGTVSLDGSYGGSIIGYVTGNITLNDSYADGTVNGGASYVGGLIGSINSGSPVINHSYAAVTINGAGSYYGGIIGGFFTGTVQNSFAVSDLSGSNPSNIGGLFGVGDGTSTNNYLDEYVAGTSDCANSGAASCTAVNSGNATPNYFINNSTNDPLDTWTFTYLWENSGHLPQFATFGALQVDTPDVTSSTINFGYSFLALSGSGTASSPQMRYRESGSSDTWTYVPGISASDLDFTLTGLSASTTYEIQLRITYSNAGTTDWDDGAFTSTTSVASAASSSSDKLADTGENSSMFMYITVALIFSGCASLFRLRQKKDRI